MSSHDRYVRLSFTLYLSTGMAHTLWEGENIEELTKSSIEDYLRKVIQDAPLCKEEVPPDERFPQNIDIKREVVDPTYSQSNYVEVPNDMEVQLPAVKSVVSLGNEFEVDLADQDDLAPALFSDTPPNTYDEGFPADQLYNTYQNRADFTTDFTLDPSQNTYGHKRKYSEYDHESANQQQTDGALHDVSESQTLASSVPSSTGNMKPRSRGIDDEQRRRLLAKFPKLKWISTTTNEKIKSAVGNSNTCGVCGLHTNIKRLRIHVRQHFTKVFCPCGYNSVSRDTVYSHQISKNRTFEHGGKEKRVFESDVEQFESLARFLGWDPIPAFGPCIPALDGQGKRQKISSAVEFEFLAKDVSFDSAPIPENSIHTFESETTSGKPIEDHNVTSVLHHAIIEQDKKPNASDYLPDNSNPNITACTVSVQPVLDVSDDPTPSSKNEPTTAAITSSAAKCESCNSESSRDRWLTKTNPSLPVVERHAVTEEERLLAVENWFKQKEKADSLDRKATKLEHKASSLRKRASRIRQLL